MEDQGQGHLGIFGPFTFGEFKLEYTDLIGRHKGLWWSKIQTWNKVRVPNRCAFVVCWEKGIASYLLENLDPAAVTLEIAGDLVQRSYDAWANAQSKN